MLFFLRSFLYEILNCLTYHKIKISERSLDRSDGLVNQRMSKPGSFGFTSRDQSTSFYPSTSLRERRTVGGWQASPSRRLEPFCQTILRPDIFDVHCRDSRDTTIPSCCRQEDCYRGYGPCDGPSAGSASCSQIRVRSGHRSTEII